VSVCVLVAIIKKRLGLPHGLYTIRQIVSLTLFEKIPISSLFSRFDHATELLAPSNQLTLFAF